ncbi:glycosyltransferase family 90 protein [Chaetomium sp. MPI-SDFR-AT-0129]|nr:glycosyltransferase family 90 protein [Chaetomium sp. MPI-SDFR-AT-0129]
MRNRHFALLGVIFFVVFCLYSIARKSPDSVQGAPVKTEPPPVQAPDESKPHEVIEFTSKKFVTTKPKPAPGGKHPIWHLIADAEREFEAVKARQSQTLSEAVAEYRRRYGLPPPPHFDKWWAFARSKKVQLVDEFDTIHDLLTPFWGLKPSTIRARAREVVGRDNQLMGMQVRGGNMSHVAGGWDWMRDSIIGMTEKFTQHLPDMDLVFNVNDESRVVVPHDDMARLVHKAKTVTMPAANAVKAPRNDFTKKPADLNYNGRFDDVKTSRFDFFPHQSVWSHSRQSCPPDSPSRILEEDEQFDDIEKYSMGELGFVSNWTAMSDICLSPSLGSTYGFFERPNSYGVVQDLVPIFSQSKISSYADIVYPSPWYWVGKVPYDEKNDPTWDDKLDQLYWRGSTTGGFSREGGWRRQHRQRFVQKINAPDEAKVLVPPAPPTPDSTGTETGAIAAAAAALAADIPPPSGDQQQWTPLSVPRGDFKHLLSVFFSHVGQCDPGDCDAQRAFFTIQEYAKQEDALGYKHVLDMDGNAFSGRFYALLRSRSLVYKWAIFREWHADWLRPWVHYVPLSLHGEEWLEVVRFFAGGAAPVVEASGVVTAGGAAGEGSGVDGVKVDAGPAGDGGGGGLGKRGAEKGKGEEEGGKVESKEGKEAERMALRGREWAGKTLRNEDLEVWFFRLLLEYGRVVDDDRENIGYVG